MSKYFAFNASFGKKENACKCTDSPENPSAKAISNCLVLKLKSVDDPILSTAEHSSKSEAIIEET
jgi:hypothetical protein